MTTYRQEEIELDDKPINTDVNVCYNMNSHPDMLTEKEMKAVTTVFRSFESGLREATIYPSVGHLFSVVPLPLAPFGQGVWKNLPAMPEYLNTIEKFVIIV